jgi:two-component system sensor histidine kinase DegS
MDAAPTEQGPRDERASTDARPARPSREAREIAARIESLRAEASSAVDQGAKTLRSVRERYRAAYTDELTRWQAVSSEIDAVERHSLDRRPPAGTGSEDDAARPTEPATDDSALRSLRSEVTALADVIGSHQTELARLEVAMRNLESTSHFLNDGDARVETGASSLPTEIQTRIVEAQEAERTRLAQDIHDGPAQVLSNAIFQVEYIERLLEHDNRQARDELRFLREQLRRELGSVRTFISQLRPPVLDALGLDGAIGDAVARTTALTGLAIVTDLGAPAGRLTETQQTVVLRVVQEALQNVRKHGGASSVVVATELDANDWVVTVRDDGRGFDVAAVTARGRLNFGLQFMQERAELIGARFEVRSQPDGGTVVRLAIPVGAEEIGS